MRVENKVCIFLIDPALFFKIQNVLPIFPSLLDKAYDFWYAFMKRQHHDNFYRERCKSKTL